MAMLLSRASRIGCRLASFLSAYESSPLPCSCSCKYIPIIHRSNFDFSPKQRCGISSTASNRPANNQKEDFFDSNSLGAEAPKANGDEVNETDGARKAESGKMDSRSSQKSTRRRKGAKRVAFSDSDSDSEGEQSMEKLAKLVAEKEELLKLKHKEIEKLQDKVLRSYAEMENVMDRTKREAENSKKYAVQNFAKGLLDVVDNLGRASSVVKERFNKLGASKDSEGAVPLLKTLLEGVEMTEKQLIEAFRKSGIEKYDPTNEPFDPNRHNAVFQMEDSSKPPGTVAVVLKAGYMLHDRVLRPAEVGVTQASENNSSKNEGSTTEKDSGA